MEDTGAGAQSPFFSAAGGHPGMGDWRQNGSGFGHGPSGMYGQAAMQGCVPATPGVMPNFPQSQQMPGAPMQQSLHFGVSRTPIPFNGTMYGGSMKIMKFYLLKEKMMEQEMVLEWELWEKQKLKI